VEVKSDRPTCPICRSQRTFLLNSVPDIELHTSSRSFDYYSCRACDLIFINPFPSDRINEIYPDHYYSTAGPDKSLLNRVRDALDKRLFARILNKIPGKSLSVLDVGGGAGWMLKLAREADSRVSYTAVVDLNSKSRPLAVENGHEFFCTLVEDFRTERKFDLIILLNLIEHVAVPETVLRNLSNLLQPQGRVVVKTPNTQTVDRKIFQRMYWGGYHSPRHWILFNKRNFVKTVVAANLSVESLRYTQGAPQWAASVLGTLALKRLVRIDHERPMPRHPLLPFLLLTFAIFDFLRAPFFPTAQMIAVLKRRDSDTG
jgi:2-polyprenyl-3-methyl-5-hydroxy-6-metoxy-1,4-benzoquinol methylase